MTLDKSKMLTPQQRADVQYANFLSRTVIRAWHEVIRERGQNVRRRNKCFEAWALWAPRRRRMRKSFLGVQGLASFCRLRTSYNVIKASCYDVIGKRAVAL